LICRVVLHEKPPPGSISDEAPRRFREWLKELPGFVGGYHVQDSKTGRMLSITFWDSEESLAAFAERTPPGGRVGMTTDREELFDVVEEF
jgi:heme-degrading monooxygenase HmoA